MAAEPLFSWFGHEQHTWGWLGRLNIPFGHTENHLFTSFGEVAIITILLIALLSSGSLRKTLLALLPSIACQPK